MKINKVLYFAFGLLLFQNQIVCQELTIDLELQDNMCYNSNDGSAIANVSGGTPPYSYFWSNSETTQAVYNLEADIYTVTVEDFTGTTTSTLFIIQEPSEIVYSSYIEDATCFGYDDGEATIYVMGGTPPYNYLWNNGNTTPTINTSAGNYSVTVNDDNECQLSVQFTIEEPPEIIISPMSDRTICNGECVSLSTNITGGSPPYNFNWSDDNGTSYFGNIWQVCPNDTTTYQLVVQDWNGCVSQSQTVTVNVNPEISIENLTGTPNEVCLGDNVIVSCDVNGGTGGPYMAVFEESIVPVPFSFIPEESRWYSLTVSDMCGTPPSTDSIFITANELPQQFTFQQTPASGILQQGELGQILLEGSELGTIYFITSNEQPVTQEIEGTGESLILGTNFNAGTYEINSTKISCGCELIQGTVIFSNQNDISSNLFSEYKVFPNPVKEFVYFENIPKKTNFEVINSNGELLNCGNLVDDKIDMSCFSSGTYFIKLFTEKQEFVITKIVVE